MSSENNINRNRFEAFAMSFMYKMNNNGPSILPCGIPHFIIFSDELTLLNCFLLFR